MEEKETSQNLGCGNIHIHGTNINLIINNNVTKNGSDHFKNTVKQDKHITGMQLVSALLKCGKYIWGNAAYSIAFCVCRDVYNMENNASQYERILCGHGVMLPAGTVNTTMSRNPWMKYHIDNWEENGASTRALKLRDAFREQADEIIEVSTESGKQREFC